MKTLLAMLLVCSACLAQQKASPSDLHRQQMELRRDFDRKVNRLNATDLAAIKALLAKYPDSQRTNAPVPAAAPAPAPKKKK